MKKRIQVYADPEIKRRIELAAARRDMSVTKYCLDAIRQRLVEDDMLEREKIEIPIKPVGGEDLIANLRALHEKIKAHRGGKLIDVDHILDQVREERDHEILGLR
ncbi:MAG: hypothetical protein PVF45_13950 [Anaerolineae bacterium]